ncbi:hypothetical protein QJS04_geneDACA022392 [Acorus gramineus]|uniref:Toprim domain-containing protein n=1 Tax=Acorus gramineus TaxID=55184 RepID=A0AAV9BVB1_ACOGR|nr:hypothetical protein QJS04_geneDACA022392 [Acorus gramineus]
MTIDQLLPNDHRSTPDQDGPRTVLQLIEAVPWLPKAPEIVSIVLNAGHTLPQLCDMQILTSDGQNVIAFTYRRDGKLINCKYRNITKRMWQEKDTEKIFYGVDDIKDASDIIIVEGEIDKLSMEEAGFRNCVSVPCGAPSAVSKKALPSEEEDTGYQYLWSSKKYLEKASRIILATDADTPGQVLAEELARRLGRERNSIHIVLDHDIDKYDSRVSDHLKNDKDKKLQVLMCFGPEALKNVIENAELYPIHGLFQIELRVGLVGEEAEVSKSGKRR